MKKALLTGTPHHGTRRRANVPRSQQLIRHRAPHRAPSKRPHREFRPEPSLRRVPQPALPSHSLTQCCDFSETPTRDWVRPRITNMSHPNPIIRRAPSRHATMTRLESRTLSWDVRMPRGGASPGSPFHNELLPGTLFRDFPAQPSPFPRRRPLSPNVRDVEPIARARRPVRVSPRHRRRHQPQGASRQRVRRPQDKHRGPRARPGKVHRRRPPPHQDPRGPRHLALVRREHPRARGREDHDQGQRRRPARHAIVGARRRQRRRGQRRGADPRSMGRRRGRGSHRARLPPQGGGAEQGRERHRRGVHHDRQEAVRRGADGHAGARGAPTHDRGPPPPHASRQRQQDDGGHALHRRRHEDGRRRAP